MKHQNINQQQQVERLILEWNEMSQKKAYRFIEKAVYLEMIDHLIKGAQWQRATAIVNHAMIQHPRSTDLYLRKAELLLNRNMIAECIVTIQEAETFAPSNIDLRLFRAEISMAQGSFIEALEILDETKLNAAPDELSEVFLLEASVYEDLQDKDAMFKALRRCLWINPYNTEGYNKMLHMLSYKAYLHEGIAFFNKILDRDAYNWLAWLYLGLTLRSIDKVEEAIEALEYAYAIEPNCGLAYSEVADMLLERGDITRALLTYENALYNTHEDPEIYRELGHCHEKLENYHAAISFYERSLDLKKSNPEAYFRLGEASRKLKWGQKAIDAYTMALKMNNQNEFYHGGIAAAYFQTGELAKAMFSYRRACYIGFDEVTNWLRYIYFLLNIGQVKMAQKALDKAEEFAGGVELDYARVACLYLSGKKAEAAYQLGDMDVANDSLEMFKSNFEWQPDIAEDPDAIRVIMTFLP
jgi:tetratricopeptide (TPR) repeat protein